jgi:hypothetical protein
LRGDPSHWKWQCPRRKGSASTSSAHGQTANINGVSHKCGSSETYLMIHINGKIVPAMVDSGCERSVVPRRYVPKVDLQPTNTRLYAVNGNSIPVLSRMKLLSMISLCRLKCLLVTVWLSFC